MQQVYAVSQWGRQVLYLGIGVMAGIILVACTAGSGPVQFPWVLDPSAVPSGQNTQTSGSQPTVNHQDVALPVQYPPDLHGDYANYPALRDFISQMSRQHGFDTGFLEQTFAGVRRDQEALNKVSSPAEGKAWGAYRAIFMTEERVNGGVDFWNRYEGVLQSVSRQYGVAPEYLVAIIGVETQYGKNTGKHNVLGALTTLAFDYPRRSDFYRKELEQYLLLVREEKLHPAALNGSYAGAMGLGQFISSSYRSYVVDGNRDGKRDMWNPQDAIPSVANYLVRNGWQRGGGIAVPAAVNGNAWGMADTTPKKPARALAELRRHGIQPLGNISADQVNLIRLEGEPEEYWITGNNFYTITRYNSNLKYAMVVHQLAEAIRKRKFGF